jgi:replicative DNA helicase
VVRKFRLWKTEMLIRSAYKLYKVAKYFNRHNYVKIARFFIGRMNDLYKERDKLKDKLYPGIKEWVEQLNSKDKNLERRKLNVVKNK